MELNILPERFAICRLRAEEALPAWAAGSSFSSITRSPSELSIVCEEKCVPAGVRAERDQRGLKVRGLLLFSATGVLSSLAVPLAEAKISIFAVSTYDTDYLLVKEENLEKAVTVLSRNGYQIQS